MSPSAARTDKPPAMESVKRGEKKPTMAKFHLAGPRVATPVARGQGVVVHNDSDASSTSNGHNNGSGSGDSSNSNAAAICGTVDFESSESATYNRYTGYYERRDIIATVYYVDGTSKRVPLDWTWRYREEADDPLRAGSNAPMLFQFPPPEQRASEPPAVRYIMAHTTPTGRTQLLGQCPNAPLLRTPEPYKPSAGDEGS